MATWLDSLKESLANLKYARTNNPAAVQLKLMPQELRLKFLKLSALANLAGMALPALVPANIAAFSGAAGPAGENLVAAEGAAAVTAPYLIAFKPKRISSPNIEPTKLSLSKQNGDANIIYDIIRDPITNKTDTTNVVVSSPRGETHIDNMTNPTITGSYYFVPVKDSEGNPWGLSAPKDFSTKGLLDTRDKVRLLLKKSGGKMINISK